MTVLSFTRSFAMIGETLTKDRELIKDTAHRFDSWLENRGLSKNFRYAAYGTAMLGSAFAAAADPVQALGVLSFGVIQMGMVARNNSNKRTNIFLGAAMMAPHMYMLGAYTAALQVAVLGIRAYTMNVINDDCYKTRIGVSTAFLAAGFGISATFVPVTSVLTALPLAAMTFGTFADACPDHMSHTARALRIIALSLLTPYHA
ncbi:MAG: hypothetical protein CO093_03870, partial [Alphaproteobacteria bacterium CG_4_9_14_3_um_filter_47_13]